MKSIITVENLSKLYRIGAREQAYRTLRDAIVDGITAPFRNLQRLRKLTKFENSNASGNDANPELSADIIWALRDVSFDVKPGDTLGIIGRNGAGKSTLLKILSRITEPTKGDVMIYGRVSSLLEVGTGFHPELTGRENIYLNGTILGMRKSEISRKFDEIVDFSEIEKFLDTPVKHYSSGMYVRLAFAVAAHLEPEILMVDEVLAVGDAAFQKKCLGKMSDVAEAGRTVLFVSHNMNAINRLCSKAILLENGKIKYLGSTHEVVNKYLEMYNQDLKSYVEFERNNKKDVQIKKVELFSEGHERINKAVSVMDKVILSIHYEVNRPINQLHLNYYIRNIQDDIVFFSDRTDYAGKYLDAQPGIYEFFLDIPNPMLVPGRYKISIGAVNKDNGFSEQAPDCLVFEIQDLENYRSERPGHIFKPIAWEHKYIHG